MAQEPDREVQQAREEAALDLELGWRVFSTLHLGESAGTIITRCYFAGWPV